jgi:hypothetical protein
LTATVHHEPQLPTRDIAMTSPLIRKARRYLADAALAFERAPVEVAVAVFVAVTLSYAIEKGSTAFPAWVQVAVSAGLVLVAAWTGTLLHALGALSAARRWAVTFAGVLAAVLYARLVPDFDFEADAWRTLLVVGAAVCWLFAMPVLGRGFATPVDRVRVMNGRFLLRVLGAGLYTAALYAGLALALAAVDNLFELDLEEALYAHVAGWIFCVLAPWIVIGGLDEYVRRIDVESAVAGVIHRMSAFLVPPLLALYYLILYAYAIRIAVTGEIPKNLLSPMVIAAGVLALLALFLFEPRPDDRTTSRALRFTPPLFVPLAALGVWAITLRVDQYGWTEFRFLRLFVLITLGLLALGATIQLLRRQRFALHIAPLALAMLLLLSAVGPWSVLSLARRNQQARLADALAAAGIAPDHTTPPAETRTVPAEIFDPINTAARYLAQHFGPDALPPVLAVYAHDRSAVFELARHIGLQRATDDVVTGNRFVNGELANGAGVDVGGAMLYRLVVSTGYTPPAGGVNARMDTMTLRMQRGTEMLHADLSSLIGALDPGPGRPSGELPPAHARLDVLDASGVRRGTLIVLAISGRVEHGVLAVGRMEAMLLLDPPER